MTETYWNGLPTPAERVRVVVDRSPLHTWWCADLAGTERAAVRVGYPGPDAMYLDDEDGFGWWKVTEARGLPSAAHRSLPVVREVSEPIPEPGRDYSPADLSPAAVEGKLAGPTIELPEYLAREVSDLLVTWLLGYQRPPSAGLASTALTTAIARAKGP